MQQTYSSWWQIRIVCETKYTLLIAADSNVSEYFTEVNSTVHRQFTERELEKG